jgi:hypothetical protein
LYNFGYAVWVNKVQLVKKLLTRGKIGENPSLSRNCNRGSALSKSEHPNL